MLIIPSSGRNARFPHLTLPVRDLISCPECHWNSTTHNLQGTGSVFPLPLEFQFLLPLRLLLLVWRHRQTACRVFNRFIKWKITVSFAGISLGGFLQIEEGRGQSVVTESTHNQVGPGGGMEQLSGLGSGLKTKTTNLSIEGRKMRQKGYLGDVP